MFLLSVKLKLSLVEHNTDILTEIEERHTLNLYFQTAYVKLDHFPRHTWWSLSAHCEQ